VYLPKPVTAALGSLAHKGSTLLGGSAGSSAGGSGRQFVRGAGLSYERFFSGDDSGARGSKQRVAGISLRDKPVDKYRRTSEAFRRRHGLGEFAAATTGAQLTGASDSSKAVPAASSKKQIDDGDVSFDQDEDYESSVPVAAAAGSSTISGAAVRKQKRSVKPKNNGLFSRLSTQVLPQSMRRKKSTADTGDDSDFLSDSDSDDNSSDKDNNTVHSGADSGASDTDSAGADAATGSAAVLRKPAVHWADADHSVADDTTDDSSESPVAITAVKRAQSAPHRRQHRSSGGSSSKTHTAPSRADSISNESRSSAAATAAAADDDSDDDTAAMAMLRKLRSPAVAAGSAQQQSDSAVSTSSGDAARSRRKRRSGSSSGNTSGSRRRSKQHSSDAH
jgi:hypothetical protein